MPFCNICGREYDSRETACSNCGATLAGKGEAESKPVRVITRGLRKRRLLAGVIDVGIAYAIIFFLLLTRRFALLLLRRPLAIVIPNVYLLLKDSIEGRSIGKLVSGILAYNEEEKSPSGPLDSILRNWYLALPFVGPTIFALIIGFQIIAGKPKRLGETWAKTIVITDSEYQSWE